MRLTPDEEILLTEQATKNGLTLSDYIRQAAIGSKPRLQMANSQQAVLIRLLGGLGKIITNISVVIDQYYLISEGGQELWEVAQTAKQGVQSLSDYLIPLITQLHFQMDTTYWDQFIVGFEQLERIAADLHKAVKAMNSESSGPRSRWISGHVIAAPLYGLQTVTAHLIQILNHGAERKN